MASSIDDFFAELAELEKQKDTPAPPNPDLRIPFSFIEVGKSEVFEIIPQKAPPAENKLINVTTVRKHNTINFLFHICHTSFPTIITRIHYHWVLMMLFLLDG